MDVIKSGQDTVFLVIALLLPGIILIMMRRKEKLAKGLLIIGFSLLCLLSFRPFSNFLLWGLESRYPPLMDLSQYSEVKYIVLLTAWDSDIPTLPYTSNLGYRSAFRTLEAHRIHGKLRHCKIIISGSKTGGKLMRMFLLLLNVPENDIVIDHSENTWKTGANLKNVLRDRRFILVTSATHLPRSMRSFAREGLKPIPAPADYLYGYYSKYRFPFPRPFFYYVPNTDSLMRSSAALYEYFGSLWYAVKARVHTR